MVSRDHQTRNILSFLSLSANMSRCWNVDCGRLISFQADRRADRPQIVVESLCGGESGERRL